MKHDQSQHILRGRREIELEQLKRECEALRARERRARAEARQMRERFTHLSSTSRVFASTLRSRMGDRHRAKQRIAAQYGIIRVLAEAEGFNDAIPKILKILGEGLGWSSGAFWRVDEDASGLRCDTFWYSPDATSGELESKCRQSIFEPGVELPGYVWVKNTSVWVEDVFTEDAFIRKEAAGEEGLHTALVFPIRSRTVFGVVELFRRETLPLDEELLRTATLIGDQIGQFVERKKVEEALRESEELYRMITDNSTDIISKHTPEGVYTYASPACRFLLGYEPHELIGRSAYELLHPEDIEAIRETHSSMLKLPVVYTASYRIRRKDGSYGRFETTSRTIQDPKTNAVQEIIAVSRDITVRRQAEEERERSLTRELQIRAQAEERRRISRELHDRVAHTMGVVHQSLELHEALKERDPAAAEAKMQLARKMAKEALTSTRNLSMELRHNEVRRGLEAALNDLLHDAVPPAVRSGLVVKGDETLVPSHARNQLFLILQEALRNAIVHSGCERVTVELDITLQGLVARVEDDGQGFKAEEAYPGVGLKSMQERAELMGGTFSVSSEPNKGSKLQVTVPLEGS
ncbi:MAG: PAS domain S-box protein [Rubrobacter sp.]|nr:PAS domain S-box protein [Rubrobacter sp.]